MPRREVWTFSGRLRRACGSFLSVALKDMCCGTMDPTVEEKTDRSHSSGGIHRLSREVLVSRWEAASEWTRMELVQIDSGGVSEIQSGVFMAKLLGKIMDKRNPRELWGFWSMNIVGDSVIYLRGSLRRKACLGDRLRAFRKWILFWTCLEIAEGCCISDSGAEGESWLGILGVVKKFLWVSL